MNVSFYGNITMQGHDILDVGAIRGMFNKWSIDGEGNLVAKTITADEVTTGKLKVGSQPKPSGITLYDEGTGAPYCLKISNGAVLSAAGECSPPAGGAQNTSTSQDLNISSDSGTATTTAETPDPSLGSGPSAPDGTASTTPPTPTQESGQAETGTTTSPQ